MALVVGALWALSPYSPLTKDLQTKSDRIAFASFLVELAAVFAFGLAVVEFALAQRGPRLRILLTRSDLETPTKDLTLELPEEAPERVDFRLRIMLDNTGRAAGRWIKVRVTVHEIDGRAARIRHFTPDRSATLSRGDWDGKSGQTTYTFVGKDGFVAYARPRRVENLQEWVDNLGEFVLGYVLIHRSTGPIARLSTSIWADRFTRYDDTHSVKLVWTPE